MKILITGGDGYIGSHVALELSKIGHNLTLIDNLECNYKKNVEGLEKLIKNKFQFVKGDIRDKNILNRIINENKIECVIHFAGLKSVSESNNKPLEYYSNNILGSIAILDVMSKNNLKKLIYSSSATVYGSPQYLPIDEEHPTYPTNLYGYSKLFVEKMFRDLSNADDKWKIISLRYFNPIGAHSSGLLGEWSLEPPNNLMPFLGRVGIGKYSYIKIYGNDYDTPDGTCIRDYINILDLADGHLAALIALEKIEKFEVINLGTGNGLSVKEIINKYQKSTGIKINMKIHERRNGDVATCYASSEKALKILGWKATKTIEEGCLSMSKWCTLNEKYLKS